MIKGTRWTEAWLPALRYEKGSLFQISSAEKTPALGQTHSIIKDQNIQQTKTIQLSCSIPKT